MSTITRLTLRQFVATKLADGVTDYRDAAEQIAALIPEADHHEYLIQAVVTIIADVNGSRRRSAFNETPIPNTSHSSRETQVESAGVGDGHNHKRQDRFRDHWRNLLNTVGLSADGQPKRIADMTADDLRANITHRTKLAEENLTRADQFRQLLAMLETQNVETVGQLK